MRSLIIYCLMPFFLTVSLFAQEVPLFEVADNNAIGMPPVLMDRWGCTTADIDRNGWPDIFNSKWRGALGSQLYMNDGGVFTEIYENSPDLYEAERHGNATRTPVFVDYDNDGDRDLMLGTDYNLFLFRNDNNVFTNVTEQMGITSSQPGFVSVYGYEMSAWIDYDLDGDNDAVVFQTNNPNLIFYRNDGDHFTDIAEQVGLAGVMPLGNDGDRGYFTGRLQWVDFDNDGDPDLNAGYLLFRNDGGHFTEVSDSVGFLPAQTMRFTDWFDYDNDGDMDFIMQGNTDELWKNNGGKFVNATQEVALDLFTKPAQACLNVGDLDNDGDQDVFIQINDWLGEDIEALLLNIEEEGGERSLVDVGYYAGLNKTGDRKGSVILDYDMDGWLDIFIPSQTYGGIMYHNLGTDPKNNWIGFDLWGTRSSRDPLGTLVTLYADGKKQIRYTKAATTWKVQDNPFVHFGIGQATSIDSVVIRWPLGTVQVLKDLAINQYHKIEEPGGTGVDQQQTKVPERMALWQNYPNPFNPSTKIEYDLSKASNVKLVVYDVTGREVATLVDSRQSAGHYSVTWDGRDVQDNLLPSGIYVYRMQAGRFVKSKKMVFVR